MIKKKFLNQKLLMTLKIKKFFLLVYLISKNRFNFKKTNAEIKERINILYKELNFLIKSAKRENESGPLFLLLEKEENE